MPKKDKKDKQINIRLSKKDKDDFCKTGIDNSDIIPIINKLYYATPVGKHLEKKLLEIEKKELKNRLTAIEIKLKDIDKELLDFNNLDLIEDSTIIAIKDTIKHYLNKQIGYNNITDFLENNNELIKAKANKTNYNEGEYIKLVIDYYNKHYD
jgi:hypothetical protein